MDYTQVYKLILILKRLISHQKQPMEDLAKEEDTINLVAHQG